jgi:hypothetical protein
MLENKIIERGINKKQEIDEKGESIDHIFI